LQDGALREEKALVVKGRNDEKDITRTNRTLNFKYALFEEVDYEELSCDSFNLQRKKTPLMEIVSDTTVQVVALVRIGSLKFRRVVLLPADRMPRPRSGQVWDLWWIKCLWYGL
jgi:hypothetical protein